MNQVLDATWSEQVTRLRLGVGAVDALGRAGVIAGLGLHVEDVPRPWPLPADPRRVIGGDAGLPGVAASPSGRFALAFPVRETSTSDRVTVRVVDPARRYVPRRLSVPAPALTTVIAADVAHAADPALPLTPRACWPRLFPGAAYGVAAGATVLRGVVRAQDGTLLPWARVVARTARSIEIVDDQGHVSMIQPVLGRAHGDDRGEFLLVVGALPREVAVAATTPTIDLEVVVQVRPVPPVGDPVDSPTGSRRDPLWHLPVEVVPSLDPDDDVTTGVTTPGGYVAGVTVALTLRRGAATRPAVPFVVP